MAHGLFITGTGTDVGKTYVTALLIKALREKNIDCGYYKAALSGANTIAESDAGYVNRVAGIGQEEHSLLSYLYRTPVSPHLAAQLEGNPFCLQTVNRDFQRVAQRYHTVVVEGSGGIICPLRWDAEARIMLLDLVRLLALPTVIVAAAGLGTINATVLTVEYLKSRAIPIKGIILNHFTGSPMEQDNLNMIVSLTDLPILATVAPDATSLSRTTQLVAALWGEGAPE